MTSGKDTTPRSRPRRWERLRTAWQGLRQWLREARALVRRWRQRLPQPVKRVIRRGTRFSLHAVNGVLIALLLIFVAARTWLPTLAERKADIETYVSDAVGNPVRFERLETFWDGLNPGVVVQGFRVSSAITGQPAVSLREVRLTLAWWPLVTGRIEIGTLLLVEPNLALERTGDGRLRVTGIEVSGGADPALGGFSEWLLRQQAMVIENGTIEWFDRSAADGSVEQLTIRRAFLELRNDGDRHRLELRADFPAAMCVACRLSADFVGRPFVSPDWSGTIAVQARELTLQALPGAVRAALPAGIEGRLRLQLDSKWRRGRPVAVEGRLGMRDLSLSVPRSGQPLSIRVRSVDTNIDWRGEADRGRLDLGGLLIGLTRDAWRAGTLRVEYAPEWLQIAVEHVDLGDVAGFAAGLEHEGAVFGWLRAARPDGGVEGLRVQFAGPVTQPTAVDVQANLRAVRFAAYERLPGTSALSGRLQATRDGGRLQLEGGAGRFELPRVFAAPLDVQRLGGRIDWRRSDTGWLVQATNLALDNRDGRATGEFELRLPTDPSVSPVIELRATVRDGNGAQAARYFPLILPAGLRGYLERAVVSGRVTEATVVLHGALRNFPFRDGKGRFEVRAHVEDGRYEYLPGWVPIEAGQADLLFTGTGMLITISDARIGDLKVARTTVGIVDFKGPDGPVVQVNGRVTGPTGGALAVLADSKSRTFAPYLLPGTAVDGDGVLLLDISLPVRTLAPVIRGRYALTGNHVVFPFRNIRIDALAGAIDFTQAGLDRGELRGELLGGDTVLEIGPVDGAARGTQLVARGRVTQSGLTQVFGTAMSQMIVGEAPWQARLELGTPTPGFRIDADLRAAELRFPAPLGKAHDEPLTVVVRSLPGATDSQLFDLEAGGRLTGRLALARDGDRWRFDRGHIGVAERITALPDRAGLTLSARLASFNADRWWQFLRATVGDGPQTGWPDLITRVSAEVDALEAFGRPLGHLSVAIDRSAGRWQGSLQGDAIAGDVVVTEPGCRPGATCRPPADRPAIRLSLTRLALPAARRETGEEGVDPRSLPTVELKSAAFSYADRNLGEIDFAASPVQSGWQITRLNLTQPHSGLKANGMWEIGRDGKPGTRLEASLQTTDTGALLSQLGYADEVVGGKLLATARASWPGSPAEFSLGRVDADITVAFSGGRLPKISPGAGRLLGVLDLGSLARYVTLDFSQLFGKGLTFDSMKGRVLVADGDARLRDFQIRTPGADVLFSGRTGLVVQDFDLQMQVTPRLMEELAVTGGLIGGPAVGAAVAVLHNLVKKPFEKGTRVEYLVTGSWSNPNIKRIRGPEPEPGPFDGQ